MTRECNGADSTAVQQHPLHPGLTESFSGEDQGDDDSARLPFPLKVIGFPLKADEFSLWENVQREKKGSMGRTLPSELCLLLKTLLISTHIHRETITSLKTAALKHQGVLLRMGRKEEALVHGVRNMHGTASTDNSVTMPQEVWGWLSW